MSIEADFGVNLVASLNGLAARVGGLCDRLDRETRERQASLQQFRQALFVLNVPIVAGAASLNPSTAGPDIGFYWSIRKLAVVGFSAGTVNTYVDNTGGEPIVPYPVQAVNTFGKGEQLINPNSSIAIVASGITLAAGYSTVQVWGRADQFETWLLPWYMGAQRDDG